MKRNSKGMYNTVRNRYSRDTYVSIFKIAVEYREEVGVLPLPSHLAQMASVCFKVAKKVIMFISGEMNYCIAQWAWVLWQRINEIINDQSIYFAWIVQQRSK